MAKPSEKKGYVKGSLKQVSVPKVLYFIHNARKTGVLAIAMDKKKLHMHFLKGNIVYVTSSYFSGLSLGDFLLKEGKISIQIHEEALDKIINTDVKQGTYLIEKGYLSPHDLAETLNRHVLEKLFWMFEWESGDFYFKESDIINEELRLVDIPMQKLVYQGVRDHMPLRSLPLEFKGRKENVLFRRSDISFRLDSLGMGPIDTRILSFVNGQYTLRQIVALARLKKRAIYKILYGLYLTDVICFTEGAAASAKNSSTEGKGEINRVESPKKEGYEVNISNDIIAQAMKSVDRIHKEVSSTILEKAQKAQTGTGDATLDELGTKLDATVNLGKSTEDESRFGFDDSSSDGFASLDDENIDEHGMRFDSQLGDIDAPEGTDEDYSLDQDSSSSEQEYEDVYNEEDQGGFQVDVNDYTDPNEVRKQGMLLMEEERWDDAEAFLQKAIDLLPDDWELYAFLGWAIYNSSTEYEDKVVAAEATIKQGMGSGKSQYQHFLFLGKLYLEEEHYEFAELHFIKALEMNVDCLEAREHIKYIHAK